jgi:hypothetical protein
MSNHIMQVDFFGNAVRAETDGLMVSLNDLFNAGNAWRLANGKPACQMATFLNSVTLSEYVEAASIVWSRDKELFVRKVGKGNKTRTMVHVSVALLAAEQISPMFHATAHRTFIENQLLEFRGMGGTEFKQLNAAIDIYLPGRDGKDNSGIYIQCAKAVRARLLGKDAVAGDWDKATVAQIHSRYETEKTLVGFLRAGVVRDYEHLKELIDRV